jgi:hypothetical protein
MSVKMRIQDLAQGLQIEWQPPNSTQMADEEEVLRENTDEKQDLRKGIIKHFADGIDNLKEIGE